MSQRGSNGTASPADIAAIAFAPHATLYLSARPRSGFALLPYRPVQRPPLLKIIVYLASAIPVFLFVRSVFFRRSEALKAASSSFNRQVGYLAAGILSILAISVIYFLAQTIFGR